MRKKKLFMYLVSMVMTMLTPTAQAQTIEELQAAIDRGSLTRAGSVDEVDLSPYSSLELDGTLYIRSGQRKRFVNGTLRAKSGYSGALVTVQAGGYLELPSGVHIYGVLEQILNQGLVNVTGGELVVSGAEIREGGSDVSMQSLICATTSNNSSVSTYSKISVNAGFIAGQIQLSSWSDVLNVGEEGHTLLNGIIASSPNNTITLSCKSLNSWQALSFFSNTQGKNAHLSIKSALQSNIKVLAPTGGIIQDNVLAQGDASSNYTLTSSDLSHFSYYDEKQPDAEWNLYLEDNAVKVKAKYTSFDLQAELDKVAAAGTYTYEKPATITIPAEGVVIDKEIIVDKKCHAVLTGGPIVIDNNINAKHVFALSGSIILQDITFDCNNNNDCLFEYYFSGEGNLCVGDNTSFINCSRETPVGLFCQREGALLRYQTSSVFKTKKNVVYSDETTKIYINNGSVESQDVAIIAPQSSVEFYNVTIASAGDYVIRCKYLYVRDSGTTIKSLREDASSVVLIEAEELFLIKGQYIGEGSRIIVKYYAGISVSSPIPTIRLEKDATVTVTKYDNGENTNQLTLAGDWQDFTIGKNVVYCDVADTAKINFLKPWPSGAYPTYYKSEGAFCFADLQWIIDHPLNNTGEDDEPVNIAVPCDGLNTQKDISLAGLQALIDGSPTEECGEPIPIKIHPLCTSCSTTPPTIIVKPWNCGGDVEIPEGSCISLTNIYVDGLGGTKRIYVYGTLIIDINVYIRNFGGCAIHVRPGGHVIYRGNGGGATGFIYNEGGRVTIEQGEMGGGYGFGIVNIDGTVEIFCGCKDTETPTKIYGGIQNGNANGGGGTIHIYGGDIYEGGIVNHGTIYIHGGTFHSPGGRPTIENHGEIHLDGGLVDGDIYTYNDLHLCGCASVTDIYLRGGKTIYVTERLQIKLRIHVFIQGTFGDGSCIAIGKGGYVLTEEDLKLIEIILPDGYEWEYDNERHAILVKQTTGIRDIECNGNTAAPVYTLKGQKAGTTAEGENIGEGIYIINGKKRIVKRPEM